MTRNILKIRVLNDKPSPFKRFSSRSQAALLGFFLTSTMMTQAFATDFVINNGDTAGLIAAINSVNSTAGPHTITLSSGGTYTLTQIGGTNMGLPAITGSVTINGNGATIDGGSTVRAFVIGTGASTANVILSNVTIRNTLAMGGTGSGGGLGAGGAVYVGSTGNVTVTNVTMQTNAAQGGAGGSNIGNGTNALAGGGMVTNGGADGVGGNGLAGTGGGIAGTNFGTTTGGLGGMGGGGGGGLVNGQGGDGGFGGGGGGSINSGTAIGGAGGFGGGGGAIGASGSGGVGGFAAGNGGTGAGGGGAGLGGAVFVQQGGSLTLGGSGTLSGNTVTGGLSGGAGGTNGSGGGNGIFLQGSGTFSITPGVGNTTTINDVITDQYGMTHATADVTNRYGVAVIGPGTVVLGGTNTYSGQIVNGQTIGTTVTGGAVVAVSNNSNLGDTSAQIKLDSGELKTTASMTSNRGIILGAGGGTLNTAGNTLTHSGIISGSGTLITNGGGTVNLSGTNSYSGGTIVDQSTLGISTDTPNGTGNLGSGTVTLRNNGTLRLNSNTNLYRNVIVDGTNGTINMNGYGSTAIPSYLIGSISGNGQLTLANTSGGIATLLNAITTSNGVVIAGGTLRVADAAAYPGGSISGPIVNNGTLEYNRAADLTLSQVISGSGNFIQTGPNTITMTADNSYTGLTTVNGGALNLGNGGTAGSVGGDILLNNNTTLGINRSGNANISNNISGNGNVAINGSGNVSLTGTNSFTGNLLLNNGYILTNNDASLGGAGSSLIFNGGGLRATGNFSVNRPITLQAGGGHLDTNGFNITENGVISGVGALIKEGTGHLNLTSANSYSGGTTITAGTVDVSGAGTLGTGGVAINQNGTLALNTVGTTVNVISGTGNLIAGSGGLTVLTGNSSDFAGNTTINSGTNLSLGNGGATGSIGGTLVNNGILTVNRNNAVELGAISGTGGLVQAGTGTTSLTGANSYSGGTSVNAGTLQLGNGGTTGSLTGDVTLNGGTFGVNRSNAVTLNNNIIGTGHFAHNGTGTTTLSGTNTFTGNVNLNAGAVAISSNSQLGDASNNVIMNGGRLITTAPMTINRSITLLSPGGGTIEATSPNVTTLSGVIAGPGALTKDGTGTVVLTGANTYTGATNVAGGTLELGTGGSLGAGVVNLSSGTNLNLASTLPTTLANVITGAGTVNQNGTGTTTLTGANTYSGGTNIHAGTLTVGNGGALGTGAVVIDPAGTLAINTTAPFILNNPVTGAGTVDLNSAGGVTVLGLNPTFTGNTNVNTGHLTLGNGTTAGSLGGNINTVAGTGVIANAGAGTVTLPANINGAGSLTTNGPGTVILTGNSNPGGGTTIASGTLQLGNGTTQGILAGNIANNGTLAVNNPNPTVLAGVISGTGNANILPNSTVTMLGNNTYTGTTRIDQGAILNLGNGGTTGTVAGNIVNNGTLGINHSNTLTLAGNISGTGNLNQVGSGTTNLTGTTSYTGTTSVTNGILNVSGNINGPVVTSGTGQINVGGTVNGAMAVGGTGALGTTGVINGPLTITSGGVYSVNGTVTGNVNVAAGGTLQGTGQMGSITNAGTFAPGNSVGTATVVTGDLTLLAGGNYQIEISPTQGDRVNISQRANLAGGFELLPLPPNGNFSQGYRYNVINAGMGVNGQFQTFTAGNGVFGANIRPILQYNPNNVEVVLQAERLVPLTTNLSRNNQALAQYFDASTLGQAAANTTNGASTRGILTPIYNATMAQMGNALDQMSGQVSMGAGVAVGRAGGAFVDAMMGAGLSAQPDVGMSAAPNFADSRPMTGDFVRSQGFIAGRRVAGTMSNPYDEKELIEARPYDKNNKTRTAYRHNDHSRIDYTMTASSQRRSYEPQYAGWGQAIGGFGLNKGDASLGVNQVDSSFAGVAGGYTYRPEQGVTIGFGLSGVHAAHSVANGLGSGTADGMSLGVFGKVEQEKLYVAGSAGVGLYQFGTTRQMNLIGNTDTLKGSYNGTWIGGRGEIGVNYEAGKAIVTPFAAVQYQMVRTNGYSETNQNGAQTGLTFASRNHVSTRSELGINVETKRKVTSNQWMTVRGTVAWSHEFMPINSMAASLTQLPGASFVLQGAKATTDAMLIAASAELQVKKSWSLNARISGEFSEKSSQIIGQVGAKYIW